MMVLDSLANQNLVLYGSPKDKTAWKRVWKTYRPFGKQHFQLTYLGTPEFQLTSSSTFVFEVKRYADLVNGCTVCFRTPTIWSPLWPPQPREDGLGYTPWAPYEFRWIDYFGAAVIERVSIQCGATTLQEYSGRYMLSVAQRDLPADKLALYYEMIGHVPEMNDPGNAGARVNCYPNAFHTDNPAGAEPSIASRLITVPLGGFFCSLPEQAFPLVAAQYNQLHIHVTFRPVQEWFTIRDVTDWENRFPVVAPNFNQSTQQFYRFLQTPPDVELLPTSFVNTRTTWFANLHIDAVYYFLSSEERLVFANNELRYVVRRVHEQRFDNVTGSRRLSLSSLGHVLGWMFFFQRSDVRLRNQWSNYSNWPYEYLPHDVQRAPLINPDGSPTGLFVTGVFSPENVRDILVEMGILLGGEYQENQIPATIYDTVEKFAHTRGCAPRGLYCYNYALRANADEVDLCGALNASAFKQVQLEFTTILPPLDPHAQVLTVCDPATGDPVAINKASWRIYLYNYDLYVMEERLNFATFLGGNVGLAEAV